MSHVDYIYLPGFGSDPNESEFIRKVDPSAVIETVDPLRFQNWVGGVTHDPAILIGYSLGGRMALTTLENSRFTEIVFISTNPGLRTEGERELRIRSDEAWAKRLLEEDPQTVAKDWESQEVFRNTTKKTRLVGEPRDLAQIMTFWSLGRQKDYRPIVKQSRVRQLWIFGERDKKFMKIHDEDFRNDLGPCVESVVISDAGHRVHLDQPTLVGEAILNWRRRR